MYAALLHGKTVTGGLIVFDRNPLWSLARNSQACSGLRDQTKEVGRGPDRRIFNFNNYVENSIRNFLERIVVNF